MLSRCTITEVSAIVRVPRRGTPPRIAAPMATPTSTYGMTLMVVASALTLPRSLIQVL
jgi:hypothetical protein